MQETGRDRQPKGGISGAKVILALIGGMAVVLAVVLLGVAVFEPEEAPCASGEMSSNVLVDGRYEPRHEIFDNVEDAEAFICRDVPELKADGWTLERIEAERTVPLGLLIESKGLGIVTLGYLEDASGRALTIEAAPFFGVSYFESQVPEQRTEEPVHVNGNDGTAYRFGINPDAVTIVWIDDTLEQRASTQLAPDFQLSDLIEVLDTLD